MATKPKFHDPRNDLTLVWDKDGVEHKMSLTNAREVVRHSGWTMDALAAAALRAALPETPAEPVTETAVIAPVVTAPVEPTITAPVEPATAAEDLGSLSKATLLAAANAFNIESKIDGRASPAKIVTIIEAELDQRLSQGGDFEIDEARTRRAYVTASLAIGVEATESMTISEIIAAVAIVAGVDAAEKPQE